MSESCSVVDHYASESFHPKPFETKTKHVLHNEAASESTDALISELKRRQSDQTHVYGAAEQF